MYNICKSYVDTDVTINGQDSDGVDRTDHIIHITKRTGIECSNQWELQDSKTDVL